MKNKMQFDALLVKFIICLHKLRRNKVVQSTKNRPEIPKISEKRLWRCSTDYKLLFLPYLHFHTYLKVIIDS